MGLFNKHDNTQVQGQGQYDAPMGQAPQQGSFGNNNVASNYEQPQGLHTTEGAGHKSGGLFHHDQQQQHHQQQQAYQQPGGLTGQHQQPGSTGGLTGHHNNANTGMGSTGHHNTHTTGAGVGAAGATHTKSHGGLVSEIKAEGQALKQQMHEHEQRKKEAKTIAHQEQLAAEQRVEQAKNELKAAKAAEKDVRKL